MIASGKCQSGEGWVKKAWETIARGPWVKMWVFSKRPVPSWRQKRLFNCWLITKLIPSRRVETESWLIKLKYWVTGAGVKTLASAMTRSRVTQLCHVGPGVGRAAPGEWALHYRKYLIRMTNKSEQCSVDQNWQLELRSVIGLHNTEMESGLITNLYLNLICSKQLATHCKHTARESSLLDIFVQYNVFITEMNVSNVLFWSFVKLVHHGQLQIW